jgi:hypothetical protein
MEWKGTHIDRYIAFVPNALSGDDGDDIYVLRCMRFPSLLHFQSDHYYTHGNEMTDVPLDYKYIKKGNRRVVEP